MTRKKSHLTPTAAAVVAEADGAVVHAVDPDTGERITGHLTVPSALVDPGLHCPDCRSSVAEPGGDAWDVVHAINCYLGERVAAERQADLDHLDRLRAHGLPPRRERATSESDQALVATTGAVVKVGEPVIVQPGPDGTGRERWWPRRDRWAPESS